MLRAKHQDVSEGGQSQADNSVLRRMNRSVSEVSEESREILIRGHVYDAMFHQGKVLLRQFMMVLQKAEDA